MTLSRFELVGVDGTTIPLDGPVFYAGEGVETPGMPAVAMDTRATLGGAGLVGGSRQHLSSEVRVPILIVGDNPGHVEQSMAILARAVNPVPAGDVILRAYRTDGTAREIVATYRDGLRLVNVEGGATVATVPLVLEALDPYWRATAEVEQEIIRTEFEGGGEPTPFDAPIAFDAAIPFDGYNAAGFQFFHLDIPGDVQAWPRFEVVGPGTSVAAYNRTVGQSWEMAAPIGVDARFVFDTDPRRGRRATLEDVNVFEHFSDDSDPWPLVPGRNHVGMRIQSWTAGRSRFVIAWRPRFLTW